LIRRSLLAALSMAAFATLAPGIATAQDNWPNKPVKVIVPFPPGGTSDVMARLVAGGLSKELGQQFVIENIGGAGGMIGTARTAKMAPDGYTILLSGVGSNAVMHGLNPNPGYDSLKDFVPIGQIHSGPNVLAVHPDQPFKTVKELLEHVRRNPGRMTYGYTHAASGHMAMELLKQVGGSNGQPLFIVGIPYRGGGPMLTDLLGGQVPMVFLNQDAVLPHVKAGKLRALAVTSTTRNPLFPDVPTIAEAGIRGYEAMSWSGLSAIKGTPQPIVDKLEAAMRKVMGSAEIRERLESQGFVVPPAGSAHYAKYMADEIALWARVIKSAGIKAE
jgi:tripartite-type tricarboxylate transporter receptor subunit TctC